MKKLLCVLLALVLCFALCACTDTTDNNNVTTTPTGDQREVQQVGTKYPDKTVGFQLEMPTVGEEIAVMHTNYGDIYIRFFPEAAPKAVENFKTHAKNGYYNNLTFHRVIADFMIQGGDPKGDGTGGESIYGAAFEDEFDQKLLNLRGSLSMANSGVNTNGSQFFINQANPNDQLRENMEFTDAQLDALRENIEEQYKGLVNDYGQDVIEKLYGTLEQQINSNMPVYDCASISSEVWELYEKTGGNLHLDGAFRFEGGHTVFGQVFKGMDVVDAIAAVSTDPNYKPKENVIIQSIDVATYQG